MSEAASTVETIESDRTIDTGIIELTKESAKTITVSRQNRRNYTFLTGIRGVAAFYVVLHHFLSWSSGAASPQLRRFVSWTAFGHFAVTIFIVLSGFSLMLPVVLTQRQQLRGGLRAFLGRRSWRILPPYYCALGFSVLAVVLEGSFDSKALSHQSILRDIDWRSLASHAVLLHNYDLFYSTSINMALWSIATEWQIYFVFALVLLPAWRFLGVAPTLIIAGLIGLLPHFVLPAERSFDWACPWFVVLFAGGMVGAWLSKRDFPPVSIILLSVVLVAQIGLYVVAKRFLLGDPWAWLRDLIAGGMAMSMLVLLAVVPEGRHVVARLRSILCSPLFMVSGAFSYSLYLTHCIVLRGMNFACRELHLLPDSAFWMRALLGIPLSVLFGWCFYLLCERPFLRPGFVVREAASA